MPSAADRKRNVVADKSRCRRHRAKVRLAESQRPASAHGWTSFSDPSDRNGSRSRRPPARGYRLRTVMRRERSPRAGGLYSPAARSRQKMRETDLRRKRGFHRPRPVRPRTCLLSQARVSRRRERIICSTRSIPVDRSVGTGCFDLQPRLARGNKNSCPWPATNSRWTAA